MNRYLVTIALLLLASLDATARPLSVGGVRTDLTLPEILRSTPGELICEISERNPQLIRVCKFTTARVDSFTLITAAQDGTLLSILRIFAIPDEMEDHEALLEVIQHYAPENGLPLVRIKGDKANELHSLVAPMGPEHVAQAVWLLSEDQVVTTSVSAAWVPIDGFFRMAAPFADRRVLQVRWSDHAAKRANDRRYQAGLSEPIAPGPKF